MDETGQDSECYGPGSIAGAVIGTFLATVLLLTIAAFLYKQWRRHKGKHLVLVTDPEIVEDAYAFDNPCFKDATPAQTRSMERPMSVASVETQIKDTTKWSTPFSGLGIGSGNKYDKRRRTLDDSCLGMSKATRVSVVSLRSRDFTGLGFNVCGNMREGIFVKDLLHRGPASESGRINPGDRIASVKISFRSMVYEDALTILSYASPYEVELEVESGGSGSRPTTLLKKTVGPSPTRIYHPLYRSQSIPELSMTHKSSAKRLFIADTNDSFNSTLKSSKSTPGSQTLERKHDQVKTNNHHQKFGIKVLPALDGTVHRIENQNEHNTNLERKHSRKKLDVEIKPVPCEIFSSTPIASEKVMERLRQREARSIDNSADLTDSNDQSDMIPSEVPAEVHNAAMAARRNRKNSAELLSPFKTESGDQEDRKSPQKNKRKAPAPPHSSPNKDEKIEKINDPEIENRIETITDYTESLNSYVEKVESETEMETEAQLSRVDDHSDRRNSESDTDSELHHSFTTIELNPSDITIHHTPVPRACENENDNEDEDEDEDDVYRKAASLGDLSKYEAKSSTTLERAQSLDMADSTASKKRKAPLPPEDIAEFNEDLTKLDDIDTFDRRKLKKSSEWGTLEDALWKKTDTSHESNQIVKPKARKKSSGTLERSKSAVEIKVKEDNQSNSDGDRCEDKSDDCSVELYNLPLSKRLTRDFIHAERMFNPDEDNSLARIVNNGRILKSSTPEQIELDFRQARPMVDVSEGVDTSAVESFDKALRFFNLQSRLGDKDEGKTGVDVNGDEDLYVGMKQVEEEPVKKTTVNRRCPFCEGDGHHDKHCEIHSRSNGNSDDLEVKLQTEITPTGIIDIERQIESPDDDNDDDDDDDGCGLELPHVTIKRFSPEDQHNVSNISVSSEDSGLVGESGEFNADSRPPLPNTPAPSSQESSKKLTYITEIKVLPRDNRDNLPEVSEIHPKPPRGQVTITSNGKPTPGKKPPVPPRRNDASKSTKVISSENQVVYVSEFKSPEVNQNETSENTDKSSGNKKFEHWIFLGDNNKEPNSWGNGSNQPQPVTNIVVSSGEEKIFK